MDIHDTFKVFSKQFANVERIKVTKIHKIISGSNLNFKRSSLVNNKIFICINFLSKTVEALRTSSELGGLSLST